MHENNKHLKTHQNRGKDVEQQEFSETTDGGGKRHDYFGTFGKFLIEFNKEVSHDAAIPLLGIHPKGMKAHVQECLEQLYG